MWINPTKQTKKNEVGNVKKKPNMQHLQLFLRGTRNGWYPTLLQIDFIGFTAVYHSICKTGFADRNLLIFDYLLSKKGNNCRVHIKYDKRPANNIKQLQWPSQVKNNFPWFMWFQYTHVLKLNIDRHVYVVRSETKNQLTCFSSPDKQPWLLDKFWGRNPWQHIPPSSDASEATVAYHLRIEPALDVSHSLGQRQWGNKEG